jgi:5,10-methylenetetrahydrofolate reductase
VFLTTLTDSNVTKQLRVEIIDDKEVEIPIVAGMVPLTTGAGAGASDEHAAGGESEALVFTASASSPEQAWKRLGSDSSAFVILANANDVDSLRATRRDLDFVRELGDMPTVLATYVSMGDESVAAEEVAKTLGINGKIPIVTCQLRDRDSVMAVVSRALELVAS